MKGIGTTVVFVISIVLSWMGFEKWYILVIFY
jgi:hypothetical protein